MPAPRQKQVKIELSPGQYLRERRQRLGMVLRDVEEASTVIAREEHNDEMYVSKARLEQIENEPSAPSIHKLLSLSAIYGLDFVDLVVRYGVKPDRVHHYRKLLESKHTHPLSTELHDWDTTITFPIHMDPAFRLETTQLINRMVAVWGEIPASLLMNFNPRNHIVGLVGLEDDTMSPLIRPGALVLVDGDRRKIQDAGWGNEHERPVYFIEFRNGYRCAWCQLADEKLFVIPHPLSSAQVEAFNYPDDAEIVGQVVGIAMRIIPAVPSREP